MNERHIGCGTTGHDELCLCDVVIPHPTGWVDDAIQDMWMGQELVNMRGWTTPWESDDIITYLGDLVYAKDNWARVSRTFEMPASERATWGAQMRQTLKDKLRAGTSSITTVMDELGLDMDDMNHILFTDRRTWTLETLVKFEQSVLSGEHSSPHGLGVQFDMPYKSASRLASYWPASFCERAVSPEAQVIDTLIAEHPDMTNRQLADMAMARLSQGGINISVTGDRIRTRKHYLTNRKNK